jgi:glycosyltransferase involved in cell wall biosynthesis
MSEPLTPVVSIVMAMRNSQRTLRPALRSLQRQSFRDWELILIDDGSSDDSVEVARRTGDSRLHLVVDGAWRGLPARLNQALSMARGRYVARMDADDVAFPRRLERQVRYLDANPQVDLLGTKAIAFDDAGVALGVLPLAVDHAAICASPWRGFSLAHPTWMGRLTWFERYRYRGEAIRCQDQDLLLRSYASSTFACLSEVQMGYRHGSVSLRNTLLGRYHYAASLLRRGRKTGQWVQSLGGVVTQLGLGAAVVTGVLLGLRRQILLRRFVPASDLEVAEWQQIWREVNEDESAVAAGASPADGASLELKPK